ncbi:MAG TPA: hypothetical protein VFS27_07605, partial [Blastocatellia bacterium]|nr:hypothetical protein [Blastocatellia bacterium]
MIASKTFQVSLFKRKSDVHPQAANLTYEKLCAMASKPEIRESKDGPLFSGASYKKGAIRSNDNVIDISFLGLDYDHCANFQEDCQVWRDLGIAYIAYTTHSSSRVTDNNPDAEERFRVVLLLTTPIPAAKYRALWHWANRISGGKLDGQRKDESGMFYRPAIASKDARYRYESHDGNLLDWRELDLSEPESEDVQTPALVAPVKSATNGHHNGNGPGRRYAEAALKNEVERVASALDGGRNAQLNKSAYALGQLIG